MDLDGDENSTRGLAPEYGAIFMSNIATKKLCFKRQIFGLPIAQANFVKQVKAGMLLFLFEFEKRELFGVFRAASDGALNIITHGYDSSGMQFPAQVQIEPVWSCIPLSESEFRNAIIDNYFSAKKFNFGLSKKQVQILLELFSSRRLDGTMPQKNFLKATKKVGKCRFDDDMLMETDTLGPGIRGRSRYAALDEIPEDSLYRFEGIDDDRFSNGDRVKNVHEGDSDLEPRIWFDQLGVYWTKKRKMNNGSRFLTSDATGSEICNDPGELHRGSADVGDYSVKVKSANDVWLSTDDRAAEYQVTKDGTAISSEYPRNSFSKGRRVTEDDIDKFTNEMVEKKFPVDDGSNNFISTEHHEESFGKARLLLDDNRSSMARYSVGNELMMENGPPSVLSTEHLKNCQGKRPSDDRFLMTSRLQNKSFVGDGVVSVRSTDHISNSIGRLARAGDTRNLLMSERAETDFHSSSQHFGNSVDKFRRGSDGFGTEHSMDNGFGPNVSPEYSREILCKDNFLSDHGRPRKSEWVVENVPQRHIGPAFSPEITASCRSEKNLFMNSPDYNLSEQSLFTSSIKPKFESDSFLLHDQTQHSSAFLCLNGPQNCTTLYSSSHDTAVSKTVPYDPDSPDISFRYSFTSMASHDFDSIQNCSSHKGSDENFTPLSNTEDLFQFYEAKRLSTDYDFAAGKSSVCPHPESGENHNLSSYRSSSAIMDPGYPESCVMRTPESKGSKEFTSSDPILAFSSFPNGRSTEKLTQGYPGESQGSYKTKIPWREGNEAFADEEFYPSCRTRLYNSSSPHGQAKDAVNHRTELYSGTKSGRTSVFTRLSVAREVHIQADKNDTDRVYDDCEPDASVDEVMDLLLQAHNHWLKTENSRPRGGDCNIRFKAKSKFHKENFGQPLVPKKKEIDASCDVNKNCDTVPKEVCVVDDVKEKSDTLQETRVVDFKRRSEVKKKWNEKISEGSAGISEGTSLHDEKPTSLMNKTSTNAVDRGLLGKTGKSRKLIRPDFRRKEYPDENKTVETVPYARSPVKESPNKMTPESVQDALKSFEFTGELSCNGGVAHTRLPTISDDIIIAEQSPVCILSETSKVSEPSTDQDSVAGKELLQDIKIDNTVSQVSPCETNENVRAGLEIKDQVKTSVQDILSMLRSNSSAPVSPPVMN